MQIEPAIANKPLAGRLALLGSAAAHAAVLIVVLTVATGTIPERYTVDLLITEPKLETPLPAVEKKPAPVPLHKRRNPPPPNAAVSKPRSPEPPKPVFGVTRESITGNDSAMAVPVGNTLMKEPERDFTEPSTVEPYAAPEVYEQGDYVPTLRDRVMPKYPTVARRANREGVVKLRFLVGKDGHVSQISVLSAPDGLGFREAAIAAVQQWVFEPPTVKGRPASVWVVQAIQFRLD